MWALMVASIAWGAELPSADDLLAKVDANLTYETRTSTVTMTVVNPRRTRSYTMQTFGRGETQSAIEYLAPSRDKGTKMLRMDGDLWTWLPSVERTQKISGHMLRQGMMGSDLSYEDLMGASAWRDAYAAEVKGAETHEGRPVWKVEMKATDDSVAYPTRIAWIDQETLIPLRQELYALSGMKLKTWDMLEVKPFGERQFPTKMVIVDHLREGTSTTLTMEAISFGVALEDEVFSQRWLERK